MTNLAIDKLHSKTDVLPITSPLNKILSKLKPLKVDSASQVTTATNLGKAISKQTELIQLLQHPDGFALSELMKRTNWQAHSIRGCISGILRKKLGLVVTRFKSDSGDTCYRIESSVVANE
jgi:hypothetical protein